MIELIVVIGVIAVLIGLVLPAVQGAREAARRATCAKNLGQTMLATSAFESARGGFPPSLTVGRPFIPRDPYVGIYSPQCMILPYLEQGPLFNSINFNLPSNGVEFLKQNHLSTAGQSIAAYLCPSDPFTQPTRTIAQNSYRACEGTTEASMPRPRVYTSKQNGLFTSVSIIQNGVFQSGVLPLSAVSDGLSNTLAYSEKPIGSTSIEGGSPFRDWYYEGNIAEPLSDEAWISACSNLAKPDLRLESGGSWMAATSIHTLFNGVDTPNAHRPDCGRGGSGLMTARSYHPGGVNAAMADGSVRWVKTTIDVKVWRSLATRAGGDNF